MNQQPSASSPEPVSGEPTPLFAYVTFVSIQATFIHANIRLEFGPLRWFLATPHFHHWHHGAEPEAIDKNFAVHLPVLDGCLARFTCRQVVGPHPTAWRAAIRFHKVTLDNSSIRSDGGAGVRGQDVIGLVDVVAMS